MVRLLIGGDVCPIGKALPLFRTGDAEGIFDNILPYLQGSDLSVVNLECTLLENRLKPIAKDGTPLGVPSDIISGIENSHIKVVSLANNHSFDFGTEGLKATIDACNRAGICNFGAGMNLREAQRVLIKEIKGLRIGFLGMAEHEFSVATKTGAGANPLDVINYIHTVAPLRQAIDYLVVFLHAGKEHYLYPTPQLMKTCRFLVEQGASAVICQHSHCPGCYEIYQGAPIVYGQGNLVFDLPKRPDYWYQGFLVELELMGGEECTMTPIPYVQFQGHIGLREMQGENRRQFLESLQGRSEQLEDDSFVHKAWTKFCLAEKYTYFSRLYGYNRLLRIFNRKLHFSDWVCSEKKKLMVRNVVECETHREALETLWREEKTPSPLKS